MAKWLACHSYQQVNSIGDSRYLLSIRGLSYITVAGLLAELGPLSSYQNARQLIKMAGTNPTESESAGKQGSRTPYEQEGTPWPALVHMDSRSLPSAA